MNHTGLFGGAITIDLPENVIDVSNFRQVPDNQEVFLIEGVSPPDDISIIIELLELPDGLLDQVIKMHLSDSLDMEIDDISDVKIESKSHNLGTQHIGLYKTPELLVIFSLVRVPKVHTDILMSVFLNFKSETYNELKHYDYNYILQNKVIGEHLDNINSCTKSLDIKDYDLFG